MADIKGSFPSGGRLGRKLRNAVPSSWLGRTVGSAGTLGWAAAKAATGSVRRLLSEKDRADFLRSKELRDIAEDLYGKFGDLKGPLMKAGQMASYVDLALPP